MILKQMASKPTPTERAPRSRCLWAFVAIMLLAVCPLVADDVKVTAAFNPPVVSMGQRTSYVITVEGGSGTPSGVMPTINGVQIGREPSVSNRSSFTNINGRMQGVVSDIYTFPAQAMAEGTYTMPEWTINFDGKPYQVPAAQLQVTPVGEEFKNAFFFKLEPSLDKAYVGQTLPLRVKLYWRQDVRLDLSAVPTKQAGEAYTDVDFNFNPQTATEVVNNVTYNTAYWPFLLTPLKAGKQPIGFTCEIIVQMPGQGNRRMDPFFDSPFFSRGNVERRALSTGVLELEILNPPEEGKPDSFNGAIGQFTLETKADRLEVEESEPITLTVTVTGAGNLERMGAPYLEEADGWRIYPPSATFSKTDALGYAGSKTFEYILRPESTKPKYLPEMRFSYFDPLSGSYSELNGQELAVTIKPSKNPVTPVLTAASQRKDNATTAADREAEMRPVLLVNSGEGELTPLWRRTSFWTAQAAPALGLLGLCLLGRFQAKQEANPLLRRNRKLATLLHLSMQTAEKAARDNRANDFTEAVHDTLQIMVALISEGALEPKAVTWADAEICLHKQNAPDELVEQCRGLFTAYEAGRFGGQTLSEQELMLKNDQLKAIVRQLTSK